MRIFALETDIEKVKQRFCQQGETVLLVTSYHTFSFFFASIREIFVTILIFTAGVVALSFGLPTFWVILVLFCTWFIFVFFNLMKAYIDWLYDFIIVTNYQVILLDQTSVFKHEIRPIHVDNIGAITTSTQFWNMLPFGIVKVHLKEGLGGDTLTLKYVPNAQEVAALISRSVTNHQRGQTSSLNQESE